MIRLRSLAVPAVAASMLLVAFARGVRADGPGPAGGPVSPVPAPAASAVAQLTDEELAFLRRRVPGFDRLDPAPQEKMAINVKKLFSLSPEVRTKFLERLRRAESEGPGAKAVTERLPGLHSAGPGAVVDGVKKMHAIASAIVALLPPSARDLVTENATPGSISSAERRWLNVAVANAWKRKVFEALIATPPTDAEPDANSSKRADFLALRDAVKAAGGAQAPETDRRRFAAAIFEDRVGAARRAVERMAVDDGMTTDTPRTFDARAIDERLEALGRAMGDAFPDAASAVAKALAAAAEQGRPGLEKFVHDAAPERATARDQGLFQLVRGLERARLFATGDLLAKVAELEVAVLRELKVPEAELAPFQLGGDEAPRLLVLARLGRRFVVENGPHAGLFPRLDRARGGRSGK